MNIASSCAANDSNKSSTKLCTSLLYGNNTSRHFAAPFISIGSDELSADGN